MLYEQNIPRPEYPRPQFKRDNNWINLNGLWDFTFDDKNVGIKNKWYLEKNSEIFLKKIFVPFCFQSELSGIGDKSFHDVVWYRKEFQIGEKFNHKRFLLNFGAVDYQCDVYVNEIHVGAHEGGYTGFSFDISEYIQKNTNYLVVRAYDPSIDNEIPRGKQFWEPQPKVIFYPRVSGIWQTVWLEKVNKYYYTKNCKITPEIKNSQIYIESRLFGEASKKVFLKTTIKFKEKIINQIELPLNFLGNINVRKKNKYLIEKKTGVIGKLFPIYPPDLIKYRVKIPKNRLFLWNPESPNLYDIEFSIFNKSTGEIYDSVISYFGMREVSPSEGPIEIDTPNGKIKSKNKVILLNNKPIYQKLFLVQGYWPDGLYTAPSEEKIKKDIDMIKSFGFNGLRTHQKAFDPRFLYWCDKKGLLVWSEIGSFYANTTNSQINFINDYIEMVERDYNHPSIIIWVLLNEGWGVHGAEFDGKKANYTNSLYHLIKSLDSTRLVIDDDGWYHTTTDICTKHFYKDIELLPKNFDEEKEMKYSEKWEPSVYLKNYCYRNEPIIYSEVGGYTLDFYDNIEKSYGYGKVNTPDELFKKVTTLLDEFDKKKEWIHGICYTELYDQFQEINGLLTFDRNPKFPPEKLKKKIEKLFY